MSRGQNLDFSFEFFPPKTPQGRDKLRAAWQQLAQLKPRFFSVTFGAGGSIAGRDPPNGARDPGRGARSRAAPLLRRVIAVRCRRAARALPRQGIRHIVALRGDLPSGLAASGEFHYADELVAYIRETTGDWFQVEVARHPEYHRQTRNAADEIRYFKKKVDAGANGAIMQYFDNPDAYFRFVEDCRAAGIAC